MRVALGQFQAGADKEKNRQRVRELARAATKDGADVLVLPEGAMLHLPPGEPMAPMAERFDGPFVSELRELASAGSMTIIAGMYESVPDSPKVYNTAVAVSAAGDLIGSYRKIHLFDAFGSRESDRLARGDGNTLMFQLDDMKVGVLICYDLRFPELSRLLTLEGMDMLLLPSGWVHGLLKEEHWDILVRARAIENTIYVAAADQVQGVYSGRSMLVDPMGVAVAAAGESEGLVIGEASRDRLIAVREKLPSLRHRRPETYGPDRDPH